MKDRQTSLSLGGDMGAALLKFASMMHSTLKRHEPAKGGREGWVNDTWQALLKHLVEETTELREVLGNLSSPKGSLSNEDVAALKLKAAGEAVDVANMAMMLTDVLVDLIEDQQPSRLREGESTGLPLGGAVNHPKHYNQGGIEVIEVIKAFGWAVPFCLGNAVKYILRAEHKNNTVEDLEKARWYLDYALELLKAKAKEAK